MMKYLPLLLLLLLFSCGNNHVVFVEKDLPDNNIWLYADFFNASFDVERNVPYDIYFGLEHTGDYPYENIYLRITDDFKEKKDTDIVSINLSNPYGIWYGKKSGDIYSFNTLLRKSFKFDKPGKHSIKIEQFTRKDSLEGVKAIKFYIDSAGE